MPDSPTPRRVRLSSGISAQLHTHTKPRAGDLVLIEHRGLPQLARRHNGRYLAPTGEYAPDECRIVGVLKIER